MYIFVDFHQSVHKRFQIFYPEHIFYPKFKKKKRLTELSKLMTETQTDSVYRLVKLTKALDTPSVLTLGQCLRLDMKLMLGVGCTGVINVDHYKHQR